MGEKVKDLDIGVVVLNAGYGVFGPFVDLSQKERDIQYQINCGHVFHLTNVLVDQLVQRQKTSGKKSALVFTSSGLGALPMSGLISYSSSKRFVTHYAKGLSVELQG